MILEPKSHIDRAHMLQIGVGKYFGSILGFFLSYMQPTMNPCGYLVAKQAENLGSQLAWGIGERSYWGVWFQG